MAPTVGILLAGGLLVCAVIAVATRGLLRSLVAAAHARLEVLRPGAPAIRVDDRANFFGLASRGAMQLRGNGVLALYADEIVFVQLVVDRVIRIPLDAVVVVREVGGFRGKSIARPLLEVTWGAANAEDAAVWYVADLEGWRQAIVLAQAAIADASVRARHA